MKINANIYWAPESSVLENTIFVFGLFVSFVSHLCYRSQKRTALYVCLKRESELNKVILLQWVNENEWKSKHPINMRIFIVFAISTWLTIDLVLLSRFISCPFIIGSGTELYRSAALNRISAGKKVEKKTITARNCDYYWWMIETTKDWNGIIKDIAH